MATKKVAEQVEPLEASEANPVIEQVGIVLQEWDIEIEHGAALIQMKLRQEALATLDRLQNNKNVLAALDMFEGKFTGVADSAGQPVEYSSERMLRLLMRTPGLLAEFTKAFELFGARLGAVADPLVGSRSSRAGAKRPR